jgi:hypothetical protein
VSGHDEIGERDDALTAPAQARAVGGDGVVGGPVRAPPQIAHEGDDALGGAGEQADVFVAMAGGADQAQRRRQLVALGLAIGPLVGAVDRLVIVDVRVGEEAGVHGIVGVVVAEHDVGDVFGPNAESSERLENARTVGHHAGVDDDAAAGVGDERDGGGDAGAGRGGVAHREHVKRGGAPAGPAVVGRGPGFAPRRFGARAGPDRAGRFGGLHARGREPERRADERYQSITAANHSGKTFR